MSAPRSHRAITLVKSGHKRRRPPRLVVPGGDLTELVSALERIALFDHSVSVPDLGSLFRFDPTTPLGQDQRQLAEAYGVRFAWPSTNGTTPLNAMALMAVASPGDAVLIQRDCHISALAPFVHLGLRPVYVTPTYVADLGISLGVTPEQLRQALDDHPDVKAVFLTYPNYFGVATDIDGCAQVVRNHGLPLIIDAAHGAHLRFHPALPRPAEDAGAAIVTQSTHKTCSALSQGSLALFNDERVIGRFYEVVNHLGFVSTSFSYVILQSIILAVLQLQLQGKALLDRAIEGSEALRAGIDGIDGLSSFEAAQRRPGFVALDPLRVTVDVSRLGLTGFAVERMLAREFHIYPELATLRNVLLLCTLADDGHAGQHVLSAMQTIASRTGRRRPLTELAPPPTPRQLCSPRESFYGRRRQLPIHEAAGLASAETIATYPPGCPIIVAGEEITHEAVAFLREMHAQGGVLKGASDPALATISVVETPGPS